jgi:hypothetical protein
MHGGAPGSGAPRGNQNALIGAAVRGAALSISPDLPGERARGLDGGVEHCAGDPAPGAALRAAPRREG